MASTFTDATGTVYTPAIVNVLSWKYTPKTVVHNILNPGSGGGTTITNIGPGTTTGHIEVVFDNAQDADDFANAVVLGVEFMDANHFLNTSVLVAIGDVGLEQDDTTRAAFTVTFDWGVLS